MALTDDEFEYEAQTTTTEVQATVLDCGDGGSCVPGAGPPTPRAGHYEGTGDYTCDNDRDSGAAMLVNKLQVEFDLSIDVGQASQGGHVYFQWGLVVIVAEGGLDGTLECGGVLQAAFGDGRRAGSGGSAMAGGGGATSATGVSAA